MELKDFEERYKGFTTDKLKELAEDFQDMRKDVLPILFAELESRGEHEYVVLIKKKISKYKPPNNTSIFSSNLNNNTFFPANLNIDSLDQQKTSKKKSIDTLLDDDELDSLEDKVVVDQSLAGEVLDDELTQDLFTYNDSEIVDLAVKLILKKKKELSGWKSTKALVSSKWNVSEESFLKISQKLERKRNNSQLIAIAIGVIFGIGILMLVASGGEFGFAPGLLILFWAGSSASTARHLKRILSNTDDIYDVID